MGRFRFKLSRVLDVRRAEEKLRQSELAVQQQKANQILAKLEAFKAEQKAIYTSGQLMMSGTADARMVISLQNYIESVERNIGRTSANLEQQKTVIEEYRLKLVEATRRRKLLEKLREKELETFKKLELLAEQNDIDEIGQALYARLDTNDGKEAIS